MDPLSLAMLASSLFKSNSEAVEGAKQGQMKSVFARGGQWSDPNFTKMAATPTEPFNAWGNLLAGVTAASDNERGIANAKTHQGILESLLAKKNGGAPEELNFDIPHAESLGGPLYQSGTPGPAPLEQGFELTPSNRDPNLNYRSRRA